MFTMIDEYTRKSLAIEVQSKLNSQAVLDVLLDFIARWANARLFQRPRNRGRFEVC